MSTESIEYRPDQPIKPITNLEDSKQDTVGDPIFPTELTKLLEENDGLPKADLAAIGYSLGYTLQEMKAYEKQWRAKMGKPEVKTFKAERYSSPKENTETKPELDLVQMKKAKREKIERSYEPISSEQLAQAEAALESQPEVKHIYEAIKQNDTEVLKEKSKQQLEKLNELYFGTESTWDKVLPWKKRARAKERFEQETKLDEFNSFVETMIKNQGSLTESNLVATNNLNRIAQRSKPTQTITAFTNNVFDQKTGQEIISLYLATVFDTTDEAKNFLEDGYNKNQTGWQYRLRPQIGNFNSTHQERAGKIINKIDLLYSKTGLLPPLHLDLDPIHNITNRTHESVDQAA